MKLGDMIGDELARPSGNWSDVATRIATRVAASVGTLHDDERADMLTDDGLRCAHDVVVWEHRGRVVVWLGNDRDYAMDAVGDAVLGDGGAS